MRVRIGIIGDYQDDFGPHAVTKGFLAHAAAQADFEVGSSWLETTIVTGEALKQFDALWIAPGSPYRSLEGALAAIRFARESGVPLGGACAGFQHVVLEYARSVLGFGDAAHEEYAPPAGSRLVLHRLACGVAGKELPVTLSPDSLAAKSYASTRIAERYYCSFGLNRAYRHFQSYGLGRGKRGSSGGVARPSLLPSDALRATLDTLITASAAPRVSECCPSTSNRSPFRRRTKSCRTTAMQSELPMKVVAENAT